MTRTRKTAGLIALLAVVLAALFASAASATPYDRLVAPAEYCAEADNPAAAMVPQLKAMRCMVNYAREQSGLAPLVRQKLLYRAAGQKSSDMLRCDQFSHEACGRPFTYWMEQGGYIGRCGASAAENIAWGTGALGTVRSIFTALINSAGHRANILGPYRELGLGVRVGTLEGYAGASVWTQQFGSRGC